MESSTAQVRLVNEVNEVNSSAINQSKLVRNFQCTGCGCTFRWTYQLVEKHCATQRIKCGGDQR